MQPAKPVENHSGNNFQNQAIHFTPEEEKQIELLSEGHQAADTIFMLARELAFKGDYTSARLLCKKVLIESPNYHDVRILNGRTYAWDKQYQKAVPYFTEVVKRHAGYEDAYLAWIDTEFWAGKKDSAITVARLGLKQLPESPKLKEKTPTTDIIPIIR